MSGMTDIMDVHKQASTITNQLFIAQVVDNHDPMQYQRVRIAIPGLLEGSADQLPWAIPITRTSGASNLELDVPLVGSYVIVMFQNGDTNYPVWYGSPINGYNGSAAIMSNYPHRTGRQVRPQTWWYVDRQSGEFQLSHNNTLIQIDSSGALTVTSASTVTVNAQGAINLTSAASVKVTAPTIDWN